MHTKPLSEHAGRPIVLWLQNTGYIVYRTAVADAATLAATLASTLASSSQGIKDRADLLMLLQEHSSWLIAH